MNAYTSPQPSSPEGKEKITLYKTAVENVQKQCAETGESFTQGKVKKEHVRLCNIVAAKEIAAQVPVATTETVTPLQAKLDAAIRGVVSEVSSKPAGKSNSESKAGGS